MHPVLIYKEYRILVIDNLFSYMCAKNGRKGLF